MKSIFTLLTAFALLSVSLKAQTNTDSVSVNAGYTHQVWYSFENGEVKSEQVDNWDLAFEINGYNSSIRINHAGGTQLWIYPTADTAAWGSNLDTTGISNWPALLNSDTSWAHGAFNNSANPNDQFDLGWGVYNMTTHHVTGDSIYIIQNTAGDYKAFKMLKLAGGVYSFELANLDGSDVITRQVDKQAFSERNFGYYSITNDETLNREPNRFDWDITFTQYGAPMPGFGVYPVTGVLQNKGIEAAEVYPVNDPESYEDYQSAQFSTEMNIMGYDWKSYDFNSGGYVIADSTVYFCTDQMGNYWKLIFSDFDGSSNGTFYFTKEKLGATGFETFARKSETTLYPNPVAPGQSLRLKTDPQSEPVELTLIDMTGKIVLDKIVEPNTTISTSELTGGLYLAKIKIGNETRTQKVIVQ